MRGWVWTAIGVALAACLLGGTARADEEARQLPVRIRLFITSDNQILVDGEIVPEKEVDARLRALVPAEERPKVKVVIRAHADANPGMMLKMTATARNVGYLDVDFKQAEKDKTPAQLLVVVARDGLMAVNEIPVRKDELVDYCQKQVPDELRRKKVPVFIFSRLEVPLKDLSEIAKLLREGGFREIQIRRIQQ